MYAPKNPLSFKSKEELKDYINNLDTDLLTNFNRTVVDKIKSFKEYDLDKMTFIIKHIFLKRKPTKENYRYLLQLINDYGNEIHEFLLFQLHINFYNNDREAINNVEEVKKEIMNNFDILYKLDEINDVFSEGFVNKLNTLSNVMINFTNNACYQVFKQKLNNNKVTEMPISLIGEKTNNRWNYKKCIERLKSQIIFNLRGDCSEDVDKDIDELPSFEALYMEDDERFIDFYNKYIKR